MANLNSVLSQQAQQLTRIEAKLDALLKQAGLDFVEPAQLLESPKPIKTYLVPPVTVVTPPVAAPVQEEKVASSEAVTEKPKPTAKGKKAE